MHPSMKNYSVYSITYEYVYKLKDKHCLVDFGLLVPIFWRLDRNNVLCYLIDIMGA